MKKNRNIAPRALGKVVLRRETIAHLTVGDLGRARGGQDNSNACTTGADTSLLSCGVNTQCPTRDPV